MSLNHPSLPLRTRDLECAILRSQAGSAPLARLHLAPAGSRPAPAAIGSGSAYPGHPVRAALAALRRATGGGLVGLGRWLQGSPATNPGFGAAGDSGLGAAG
jgi:hypothetical protein